MANGLYIGLRRNEKSNNSKKENPMDSKLPPDFDLNTNEEAHARAFQLIRNQLLIVLINRLGGSIDVPVSELDNTGDFNVAFKLDNIDHNNIHNMESTENAVFHFELIKKGEEFKQ